MATRVAPAGARMAHPHRLRRDDLGAVAPGKRADIIVVDGDPLTNLSELRHVVHVIKDGVVYK